MCVVRIFAFAHNTSHTRIPITSERNVGRINVKIEYIDCIYRKLQYYYSMSPYRRQLASNHAIWYYVYTHYNMFTSRYLYLKLLIETNKNSQTLQKTY